MTTHCVELYTHSLIWFHNDGFLIFLGDQYTRGEGGLDHVDDQVIGQDVQLLHLVPRHIGASSDAISSTENTGAQLGFSNGIKHFQFIFF